MLPSSRESKARKILAVLQDHFGLNLSRYTCLDIGCGEGLIGNYLGPHFQAYTAVDLDVAPIPANASHREHNNPQLAIADGLELPFPNEQFDIIICAQVYEHVSNPQALASEIERTLKPGGVVFFSGPNRLAIIEPHYCLPLLSWLPGRPADLYMQITRKGRYYDIRPFIYWSLKKLWQAFDIIDYTHKMIANPAAFHIQNQLGKWRFIQHLPNWMIRSLEPLFPNFNWILVKTKKTTPIDYTQDYYLNDCDGAKEFAVWRGEVLPKRLSRPIQIGDIQDGDRVLDIGCGRGEVARKCAQIGAQVWGLDYAPAALKISSTQPIDATLKLVFIQANADALPFPDNCFDTIFMLDIVEHLLPVKLDSVLQQVYHSLKPNGRLIIHTMPNLRYYRLGYPMYRLVQRLRGQQLPKDPAARWNYSALHVNEQTPHQLRKTLHKIGFHTKVWLENLQSFQSEKNPFIRTVMLILTKLYPFKWIFCNDILAVATKPK